MPNVSAAVDPTRRFDYVHVLLFVERFRPITSLPVNSRVIIQVEQSIDIAPDTDDFLRHIDYTAVAKRIAGKDEESKDNDSSDSTLTSTVEQRHRDACIAALHSGMQSIMTVIKKRFGAESSLNPKSSVNDSYKHEWPVTVQTNVRAVNAPNKENNSQYFLLHDTIKRQQPNTSKMNEAKSKINYAITKHTTNIRLDYLDLSEMTTPLQELYLLKNSNQVGEINLAHSNFLFFPLQFCNNFSQLKVLNLSSNANLYHLPAEIAKFQSLEKLDLTDCKNLISLPLTMVNLKHSLEELNLFGCVNLQFPPHSVCVKAQIATQEGMSRAGVLAVLDYIVNPLSFVDFSLHGAKKNLQKLQKFNYDRLLINVPSFRQAWQKDYIEFELSVNHRGRQWTVWRRYSQFLKLVSELESIIPADTWKKLPEVPQPALSLRGLFTPHEDDPEICESRRVALNAFTTALSDRDGESNEEMAKNGWKLLCKQAFVASFFELDKHSV